MLKDNYEEHHKRACEARDQYRTNRPTFGEIKQCLIDLLTPLGRHRCERAEEAEDGGVMLTIADMPESVLPTYGAETGMIISLAQEKLPGTPRHRIWQALKDLEQSGQVYQADDESWGKPAVAWRLCRKAADDSEPVVRASRTTEYAGETKHQTPSGSEVRNDPKLSDATRRMSALNEADRERLNPIPPLDKENGEWATAVSVARQGRALKLGVSVGELSPDEAHKAVRALRAVRRKERAQLIDRAGTVGVDQRGRIFRKDPTDHKVFWYLKVTASDTEV